MLSIKQRELIRDSLLRKESKVVTIVLSDDTQVAGELASADQHRLHLRDGRTYSYEQIQEINGLYE